MARRAGLTASVLAAMLAISGAADSAAAAADTAGAKPGWQLTYTLPLANGQSVWVKSVAALGRTDAWAVGGETAIVHGQGTGVPVILHWNGARWTFSRLPRPQHLDYFSTVVASARNDAWAFGGEGASSDSAPYIAHWNGVRWSWMKGSGPGAVLAAADLGPSDVWVTGYEPNRVTQWNGHRWRTYPVPGQGVQSLVGTGSRDVWAIGRNSAATQFEALHWTGDRWHQTKMPPVALPTDGQAYPLAAAAGKAGAWAVGVLGYPDPTTHLEDAMPVAYQWNGNAWQDLPVPAGLYDGIPQGADFTAVTPDGQGGFWAAMQAGSGIERLIHYRHGRWTATALPVIKGSAVIPVPPTIVSLAAIPGTDSTWAPITFQEISSGNYRYSMYRYAH
jgi:hypothetical protein